MPGNACSLEHDTIFFTTGRNTRSDPGYFANDTLNFVNDPATRVFESMNGT